MYNEPEKNEIREKIIRSSIEILTAKRKYSTITNPQYIKKVQKFLKEDSWHESDHKLVGMLSTDTFNSWEKYYKSLLIDKNASNLKVAFLAGPNPENDMKILIDNGILEENIWAFESNNNLYKEAVNNLIDKFPKSKIYKGKIENFFSNTPIKFDIVYLDFCGPIMVKSNKNKSIVTLLKLIKSHALNSPGVLITNFALPSEEQDKQGRELLAKLTTLYLYPKRFINSKICISEQGIEINEMIKLVEENLEFYYGEFISRLIMDLASVIVPYSKLANNKEYFNNFFDISENDKKKALRNLEECNENISLYQEKEINDYKEYYTKEDLEKILNEYNNYSDGQGCEMEEKGVNDDVGGWIGSHTDFFSIPWTFCAMNEEEDEILSNICDETFRDYAKAFLSQISEDRKETIDGIKLIYYMIFTEVNKHYSEKLKKVYNVDWRKIAPQFCDVFTFHSIIGVLLGQVTVPYHVNVKETRRWTYKAKSTQMFTDMFVLDECRYIYDMMPTIDMIVNSLKNIDYQLCYRFALEGLYKNQLLYNSEFFEGNAVVGRNHEGFEEAEFEDREFIN